MPDMAAAAMVLPRPAWYNARPVAGVKQPVERGSARITP
jgi:hypothetical protein